MRFHAERLILSFTLAYAAPEVRMDWRAEADSAAKQERKLYWMKCDQAVKSKQSFKAHSLKGLGFLLATAAVEVMTAANPDAQDGITTLSFVLFNASLYHFTISFNNWQDYDRDRACCRYAAEMSSPNR